MKFNEYMNILYNYYGAGEAKHGFLLKLLNNITIEQEDNFFQMEHNELDKCFRTNPPKRTCKYILSHLDKENYIRYLGELSESASEDSQVLLCKDFESTIGTSTKNDIHPKLADLLIQIFKEIVDKSNQKANIIKPNFSIEDELTNLIKKLSKLTSKDVDTMLSYEPVEVDKKILPENGSLKKEIKDDVVTYYRFIEKLFQNESMENCSLFDQICRNIQTASDNYISQGLPQGVVYSYMVKWLQDKVSYVDPIACKVLISFFVQNCEVFHAVAQ